MVSVYKTIDDKLEQLDVPEKGCWVNMTAPTHEEVFKIARRLNMDKDFLAAALDERRAREAAAVLELKATTAGCWW